MLHLLCWVCVNSLERDIQPWMTSTQSLVQHATTQLISPGQATLWYGCCDCTPRMLHDCLPFEETLKDGEQQRKQYCGQHPRSIISSSYWYHVLCSFYKLGNPFCSFWSYNDSLLWVSAVHNSEDASDHEKDLTVTRLLGWLSELHLCGHFIMELACSLELGMQWSFMGFFLNTYRHISHVCKNL